MISIKDISNMDIEELRLLNEMVVTRIRYLSDQMKFQFKEGDRVQFQSSKQGRQIKGLVHKINRKTIDVKSTDLTMFRVSPSLLEKI